MPEKTNDEPSPKRDAILAAARTLFAEKGYEETTIADIAKLASIAVGTVYLYFHNKHDVYVAVGLEMEMRLARAFRDPALYETPLKDAVRMMIDAGFRTVREHQQFMSLLQVNVQSAEELKQYKEIGDMETQAIDAILRHAVETGQLAPFNTEMYAQLLSCAAGAVIHQCFVVEHGAREQQYRDYLIEFIERLFFGPSLQKGTL